MEAAYFCVKSEFLLHNLNFDELMRRLRAYIRLRIQSGEYTERSLARVLLVSQPQLHNVLKGVRTLNVQFADRVMKKFKISVLDLVSSDELLDWLELSDPDWLASAMKRKPPGNAARREDEDGHSWRTAHSGRKA